MARLPYVDPEQAPERVAAALRELPPLNVIRTIAHADDVLTPWLGFASALLNETELDPVLREISILRIAAISPGAEYEWEQHEAISRQLGMSDAQIAAARSGTELEGDDALVARFTEEVVRDGSPSRGTWRRTEERFTPREIVELLMMIGHYMMIARVCSTFRVDPDPPVGTQLFGDLKRAS